MSDDTPRDAFIPITSLTNLETLELDRSETYSQGILDLLPQLSSLTRLEAKQGGYAKLDIRSSIAKCTDLKALDARFGHVGRSRVDGTSLAPYLTQLTEIAISQRGEFLLDLTCLTLLQCLHLCIQSDRNCSLDEVLECMPRLQIIAVFWHENRRSADNAITARLRLSGSVLSPMCHLKSISLYRVDIDESFFHVLASKTGLTKLEFISPSRRRYSRDFVFRVNLLRNLEELGLHLRENNNACALLWPEAFPKLKHLDITPDREDVDAVRKKFNQSIPPCVCEPGEGISMAQSFLNMMLLSCRYYQNCDLLRMFRKADATRFGVPPRYCSDNTRARFPPCHDRVDLTERELQRAPTWSKVALRVKTSVPLTVRANLAKCSPL